METLPTHWIRSRYWGLVTYICVRERCDHWFVTTLYYNTQLSTIGSQANGVHDDVIKWKHLPRYWPFVRGIHRSPVNFPHKGQWRGALVFSLICTRINGWVNNGEAGDLRRYRAHCDVIVMIGIKANLCLTENVFEFVFCGKRVFHPNITMQGTMKLKWNKQLSSIGPTFIHSLDIFKCTVICVSLMIVSTI